MNHIFCSFLDTFIVIYLDDILVFNNSIKEHVEHLQQVFETLYAHQQYLNPAKCTFDQTLQPCGGAQTCQDGLDKSDGNWQVASPEGIHIATILPWTCQLLSKIYPQLLLDHGTTHRLVQKRLAMEVECWMPIGLWPSLLTHHLQTNSTTPQLLPPLRDIHRCL